MRFGFLFLLFFCLKAVTAHASVDWKALALKDLNHINQILKDHHPGPADRENPFFRDWILRGTSETKKLIERIQSADGYRYALLYYVKGFQDSHLNFEFDPSLGAPSLEWSGLIISYRKQNFIVHSSSKNTKVFGDLPPKDSVLVSCDGRKALDIIQADLLPFMGNPNLEAHWALYAPYILFDHKNPFVQRPRNCLFQIGKELKSFELKYETAKETIRDQINKAAFGTAQEFSFRKVGKSIYWVRIPTFDLNTKREVQLFQRLIKSIPQARNARRVVFDLRHNRGGAPRWGDQILNRFFTPEYTSYRLFAKPSRRYGQIRASEENLAHYKMILKKLKKQGLKNSPSYKAIQTSIKSIQFSLKNKLKLTPPPASNDAYPSPVKAEVFFLTDGHCASACLIFADKLLQFPNVAHIGFPTSADSAYLEGRYKLLKSKRARLYFAVLVDRYRSRGYNEPLFPKVTWQGDWQEKELMEWVRNLPTPSTLEK